MILLKKVVFLDRDGTINKDSVDYIKNWPEFVFLPRSIEALCDLTAAGFKIIVITNQSAIGRRLISLQELENIHSKMKAAVESQGGKICDIFFCPHLPGDGCDCRKPAPGLIYQARQKHDIDLSTAVMIGDSARDIECAFKAGCGRNILVKTGNSRQAQQILAEKELQPDYVAQDLHDAARWLVGFQS
ncbi:MAG: D-glycero-beta-D-manno-heptose 1,7-bisphosphate 7-phosphatase [Deltaproteobacteria bacterium]|jgi:D-glycero-D-manno-heptose 1,7-bisphosphate phosphatase